MSTTRRAVVLGGGGTAGLAWEIGLIAGLAEAGIDVRNADLFVGTSAGSVVAAGITSGSRSKSYSDNKSTRAYRSRS